MAAVVLQEGLVLPRQELMERPQARVVLQLGLMGLHQLLQQLVQLPQLPVLGLLLLLEEKIHLLRGKR